MKKQIEEEMTKIDRERKKRSLEYSTIKGQLNYLRRFSIKIARRKNKHSKIDRIS